MKANKNIHVIPTDKPSRLHIAKNGDYHYSYEDVLHLVSENDKPYNIYITNDEEIKEGDWFIDDNDFIEQSYKLSHVQFANPKKIILTTDFDKHPRVQAIPDEFLEWFVKNPSCEEVIVTNLYGDFEPIKNVYQIIIPKEDPKQETLEEATEKYFKKVGPNICFYDAAKFGAKWQAERSYSEEDLIGNNENSLDTFLLNSNEYTQEDRELVIETVAEWIEQFKKK